MSDTMINYSQIPPVPDEVNACTAISRFVDSLGFRYYWATEGLTDIEYSFRPHESSMNMQELLHHIYSLTCTVNRTFGSERRFNKELSALEEIRQETFFHISELSTRFKSMSDEELEKVQIRFRTGDTLPFWYMLHGQIADALTHVGQVTSWRRIAGNPQPSGVQPFFGIRKEG